MPGNQRALLCPLFGSLPSCGWMDEWINGWMAIAGLLLHDGSMTQSSFAQIQGNETVYRSHIVPRFPLSFYQSQCKDLKKG